MQNVDIVIMGKTGAGKSTLVNTLIGDKVAETGIGCAVTQKNEKYIRQIVTSDGVPINLTVYDTVGLEIDNDVTKKTIKDIEKHIKEVSEKAFVDDVIAVWFCINWKCNRFEKYELELIKNLSVKRCIPLIIVLTQCPDDSVGNLEKSINELLPEILVRHILAQDYKSRVGIHSAYGLPELFDTTIKEYPRLKVNLDEKKINRIIENEKNRIRKLETTGKACVIKYTDKASRAGWIPTLSIPYIHLMRNKMMEELNSIFGLQIESEKMEGLIIGAIVTPFLAIPLISRAAAEAYINTIGESYLNALIELAQNHSNYELEQKEIILEELKSSLERKR